MSYLDKIAGISGVYCITNTLNGKQYVGQSADIGRRWRVHLNSSTLEVQKDIRTLGRENFDFKILEEVKNPEERCEREKYWIEKLGTFENGYNSTKGGEKGCLDRHRLHTEEEKEKISKALKGKPKSEETRKRMSKPKSEEHRNKLAELNKRKAQDPEYRERMSKVMKGRPKSKEHKEALAEAKQRSRKNYLFPDGTIRNLASNIASRYRNKGIEITKLED